MADAPEATDRDSRLDARIADIVRRDRESRGLDPDREPVVVTRSLTSEERRAIEERDRRRLMDRLMAQPITGFVPRPPGAIPNRPPASTRQPPPPAARRPAPPKKERRMSDRPIASTSPPPSGRVAPHITAGRSPSVTATASVMSVDAVAALQAEGFELVRAVPGTGRPILSMSPTGVMTLTPDVASLLDDPDRIVVLVNRQHRSVALVPEAPSHKRAGRDVATKGKTGNRSVRLGDVLEPFGVLGAASRWYATLRAGALIVEIDRDCVPKRAWGGRKAADHAG